MQSSSVGNARRPEADGDGGQQPEGHTEVSGTIAPGGPDRREARRRRALKTLWQNASISSFCVLLIVVTAPFLDGGPGWAESLAGLSIPATIAVITLISSILLKQGVRKRTLVRMDYARFCISSLVALAWVVWLPAETNGLIALTVLFCGSWLGGPYTPPLVFMVFMASWIGAYLGLTESWGGDEQVLIFASIVYVATSPLFILINAGIRKDLHQLRAEARKRNDELNELRTNLEELVDARSAQVDELATLLSQKVQDRSRGLARALEQIDSTELQEGDLIDDRFEVLEMVGRGGMGAVYKGRDRVSDRTCAVKVLQTGSHSASAIRRFLNEANLVSRVQDPGIVPTWHIDVTDDGLLYQVMEFVDGVSLAERLTHGPLQPDAACWVGMCIAAALEKAHAADIIHRDIKAGNVMISRSPIAVRVLDFGISKLAQPGNSDAKLTETNHIIGTPAYMSPEQIVSSATVTAATDVYSLGVLMFELLSGQLPFQAETTMKMFAAHHGKEPPDLRTLVAVSDELAEIILQCKQKSPEDRPGMRELLEALSAHGAEPEALESFEADESRDLWVFAPTTDAPALQRTQDSPHRIAESGEPTLERLPEDE